MVCLSVHLSRTDLRCFAGPRSVVSPPWLPTGRSQILGASAPHSLDAKPAVEGLQILYREGLSMKAHGDCKPLHEGVLTEKDRPGRAPATREANFVFPLDVVILITARREKAYADVHELNPNVVAAHTEHEAAVGRSGFDANGVGEVRCCQDVAGPGIYEGIGRVPGIRHGQFCKVR